jgi:hypothetical protein
MLHLSNELLDHGRHTTQLIGCRLHGSEVVDLCIQNKQ